MNPGAMLAFKLRIAAIIDKISSQNGVATTEDMTELQACLAEYTNLMDEEIGHPQLPPEG